MSRKRTALSLTPDAEDFINDAPSEPAVTAPIGVPETPEPSKARPVRAMPPLPKGHRMQVSGKVVRRVTGYISPELGQRLDEYLAREERNVGFVLERAIASWLDSKQ